MANFSLNPIKFTLIEDEPMMQRDQTLIIVISSGTSTIIFLLYFTFTTDIKILSYHLDIKFGELKMLFLKRRWCAWDLNLGPQDGRHRRNHGAMAATVGNQSGELELGTAF